MFLLLHQMPGCIGLPGMGRFKWALPVVGYTEFSVYNIFIALHFVARKSHRDQIPYQAFGCHEKFMVHHKSRLRIDNR